MIAGPSQCGKSHFVAKLLKKVDSMIDEPPERIVWCYSKLQRKLFDEFADRIEFMQGLPSSDLLDGRRTLLIIDDLMRETDGRVTDLFTKGSHHDNASVVYVSQNLYNKGKGNRTISLNTYYLVLFKNPRDSAQVVHLGKQIYPDRLKYFKESFADATSRPHGYLLIDLKITTPDELRLRTAVFPDKENSTTVYLYK